MWLQKADQSPRNHKGVRLFFFLLKQFVAYFL